MSTDVRFDTDTHALVFVPAGADPDLHWDRPHHVFVTAELQDPARWGLLIGRRPPFAPALAHGFRCATLEVEGQRMAFMLPADDPHRTVLGTLFLGLNDTEVGLVEEALLEHGRRRRIGIEVLVGHRRVNALGHVRYR